jgi:histidinol-phosphate aminotransferase
VKRLRHVGGRLVRPDEVDAALAHVPEALAAADLHDQVIIITGSTQGLGLAMATALADTKARLVVNARTVADVQQVTRRLQDAGAQAVGVGADIATEDGVQRLVDTALQTFGRIDILINNAAVAGPLQRPLWEVTPAEWRAVLDVNLTGAFLCTRSVAAWMMHQGVAGRIINISSGAARTPVRGLAPYSISKVGLEALTRTLALDAGWSGLTVIGVELGSVQTRLTRAFFSWEEFQELPPPETVLPVLLYAATAPPQQVHGRILAAWRFAKDPEGEAVLGGPLATTERFSFPSLRRGEEEFNRRDPRIAALDRAENPRGMPDKARDILHRATQEANFARYPDERYPALRQALSARLQLPEECFTFGNGSTELVERTIRTFAQPGEEVLSNDPSWFMFDRFCDALGVINRKVPFRQGAARGTFDHNLEAMAEAIGVNTRLIYLVSPSNPMGVGIAASEFTRFLRHVPVHIPIVVDEAYIEYSTQSETLRSHTVMLNTDRRVIGLRTFSKFHGLADLRVGYAFAAPATLRLLNRLEPLFVLSSLAEASAVAALDDSEHAAWTLENIHGERLRMEARLAAAGLNYVPSESNFMLVECPTEPDKVYETFAEAGIFVPKGLVLDRYLIFPIVQAAQNTKNLDILCGL